MNRLLRWPVVGTALAWAGIGLIAGGLVHPVIAVVAGAVLVAAWWFIGAVEHIDVEALCDDCDPVHSEDGHGPRI